METPGGAQATGSSARSETRTGAVGKRDIVTNVEQRITDLHKKLMISPAQRSQWDRFVQVMRENASAMDRAFKTHAGTLATIPAVENMQSYAQVTAEHAQDLQKLVPSFQGLYASMSVSQKHTADEVFHQNIAKGKQARRS